MLRAMVFIDFENFEINKNNYYKSIATDKKHVVLPKLDYNIIPQEIVKSLSQKHILVKTFLFAPKPDEFLMKDERRKSVYDWINGMRNQDYFTIIEGKHSARPVSGYTYKTMSIDRPQSFYVEEKGTDINVCTHLITKGFMNAYDTAIIVSGDTDYIPVMDVLNTLGKNIVVVGIKNQNLTQFKHHSDAQITLDEKFFNKCLRK